MKERFKNWNATILLQILQEKSWVPIYLIIKSYFYTDNKLNDGMATMKQPQNNSIIHIYTDTDNQQQIFFS